MKFILRALGAASCAQWPVKFTGKRMPVFRIYPVDDDSEERRGRHEITTIEQPTSSARPPMNLMPRHGGNNSETPVFGRDILRDHMRHVMTFLESAHVVMLSEVSKWMFTSAREDSVWQLLCKKDFGVVYPSDHCSFRETYKKAWKELVLWRNGEPDYVEFLHSRRSEGGVWSKKGSHGNTVEIMCAW